MALTTYVSGTVLTAASLNDNFNYAVTVPAAPDTAIFNETQASGTNGGSSATGSFIKRTLNTTTVNTITGCSIAASVITLPAGTYLVTASAPFYATNSTKLKLRNTTDSTDTAIGVSSDFASSNFVAGIALLTGYFTIAASKDFELQYRVASVKATTGLGLANSFSVSEIYSTIQIQKVA
jgi:hypothetical protein